jgi:hypothetical protein
MLNRCRNPNCAGAHFYGGRGITICERWRKFESFFVDMGEQPEGKTLDRINSNLGYFKENCRWATPTEQARNRRNSKLTYKIAVEVVQRHLRGESHSVIARDYGICRATVRDITNGKIWKGATIDAAFELALSEDPAFDL